MVIYETLHQDRMYYFSPNIPSRDNHSSAKYVKCDALVKYVNRF